MDWYNTYYYKPKIDLSLVEKYFIYFDEKSELEDIDVEEYDNFCNKVNLLHEKNDLENVNSLELLGEQNSIVKLLSKYILQNNYIDFEFFLKIIKTLQKISKVLMTRINQCSIIHKNKNYNHYIPRCSYKFCSFKQECFYNYNTKTKNVCYQDHFVHNMVLADLIILEDYISSKLFDNKILVPNKEILKSINTLSFVIDHMHCELKSRCLYLNENQIEKEHFIKKNKV